MKVPSHSQLISPQRLYTAMPDVQIIDARERVQYDMGHIPGAIHLPPSYLEGEDVVSGGGLVSHQLRDVEFCASRLSEAGIQDDRPIVIYDQGGSYVATRLWWILMVLGHEQVAVMNGGYSAWTGDLASVEYRPASPEQSDYLPRPNWRFRAEFSDILTSQAGGGVILCDTLPRRHFERGSIPGSINLPYSRLFVGRPVPTIRRAFEAEAVFAGAGIGSEDRVIFFCDHGYSASLAFFCGRLLGMDRIAVYDGSIEDWTARGGRLE
ncbi:sulfurtransferase [Spirochaeta africana]|uniref:Rhodanese-related sulfurtransferase n=1 Tax=Spirochaeta africana (strain ATCC 700263 / DSM 8902 / Z-7692) TaxID=889378 RepID=H9UM98_SPIAZ|nr:rhodanese-like domain-containing protein [Spirochaeta africana]AFG38641.1 rhodanese-related sulfurtransferase [Spirochaeta africana DSM 8902]